MPTHTLSTGAGQTWSPNLASTGGRIEVPRDRRSAGLQDGRREADAVRVSPRTRTDGVTGVTRLLAPVADPRVILAGLVTAATGLLALAVLRSLGSLG